MAVSAPTLVSTLPNPNTDKYWENRREDSFPQLSIELTITDQKSDTLTEPKERLVTAGFNATLTARVISCLQVGV